MNLTLDLTTILTFVAGLMGPIAVLTVFSRVAVKLSLPLIIEALMESAAFLDRVSQKLSVHPQMTEAMRGVADHKAKNVQAGLQGRMDLVEKGWAAQLHAMQQERERDRLEDREWRRSTSKQIDRIFDLLRHLDRQDARNQGRHESIHDDDPSEVSL